ncbi:MAG: glycoside hydrolase family 32 protein, partial [Verrucomicrobiota bacterium]
PWAWWTFDDKAAKERTGRFETTRLYGGAKVQDGKLVLDGKPAWLSTASEVDVDDSVFECPSVNKRFLHIPIWSRVKNSWVNISVDGVWQRELAISLARDDPDFYATLEVGQWQGRKLTLTAEKVDSDSQWNKLIKQSDEMSDEATVYTEQYRSQFHFSVRRGGLGDVNGPVYLNGEYHLFGQHWPFQGANARNPGSIVWAHAISTDLVHWVEYPVAVFPDKLGLPFSGSSVVDWENTAGLVKNPVIDKNGRLKNAAIVLFHTSYPLLLRSGGNTTQSMVYSLDAGRTWIKYPGNPVVPHFIAENRDPKVFRYEDKKNPGNPYSGRWVMALYMSGQDYALLASKDLIHWEKTSGINNAGCIDCPDMFELPVDGDKNNTRWVFWGGSGSHLIGKFDGQAFVKEGGPFLGFAGTEYAAQTIRDIPEEDGRRIQIANSSRANPGMPFEGQFTIPRVLTLRTTPDGMRLFTEPAKEIEKLRTSQTLQITGTLAGADAPLKSEKNLGELVDAEAVLTIQSDALSREGANVVGLRINAQTILCDLDQKQMKVSDILAPLNFVVAGKIKLRVILDRISIEVFVNDGAFRFTKPFVPADGMQPDIQVFGKKGLATVTLNAHQLQSIWNKKPK